MQNFPEIKISWKRPSAIPYPKVWHRYETKSNADGNVFKIRIEDLPAKRYEEGVEFMMKYFTRDEPLRRAVNFSDDNVSVMGQQEMFLRAMKEKMSLVAVLDDDTVEKPKIVALQVFTVVSKEDPPFPEFPGEGRKKIQRVFNALSRGFDPFEFFRTDAYLYDWGICVATEFRGLRVGVNLMASSKLLAKAVALEIVVIRCNCIEAQTSAEKIGCKTYRELRYADYADENGEYTLRIAGTDAIKLMAVKL